RQGTSRAPYYDWRRFRAVSDFDIEHFVSVITVWQLPSRNTNGLGKLTSGWSIVPDFTYRSGLPLRVSAGLSRNLTRPGPSGAGDPNLVQANLIAPITYLSPENYQAASTGRTGNFYFDPNAFERNSLNTLNSNSAAVANPALRTYGTLGRNAFRGPDQANINLTLRKDTKVTERLTFTLGADFFNLLNHAEFNNPSTSITSTLFGQISSTQPPRIGQIWARFMF